MIEQNQQLSLSQLCPMLGITRQAFYKYYWTAEKANKRESIIVEKVLQIRKRQPAIGGRKLYVLLQAELDRHGIKMGRDAFFDLLARNRLVVRKRKKRYIRT